MALPEVVLSETFLVVRGAVARFEHRGALAWMTELRAQGPTAVPAASAPALIEAMAQSSIEPSQLPEELRYEVVATTPRPRIRMARSSRPQGQGMRDELDAAVEFDYAGTIVPARPETSGYDPARRRIIRREATVERAALQRLQQLGFHRPWYFDAKAGTLAISVERFPGAVRALVDEGWHVEAEGRMFRAALGMQMQVQSGVDWFELRGQVDFGDGRLLSAVDLLAALRRGDATVILDDGTRGMVPEEWLRRYGRIAAFGEAKGDHVRFRPSQTALLDALLETQPSVDVDEAFARARAGLADFSGVAPLDPPATFRGELRDYQRDGPRLAATSSSASASAAAWPTTWASARRCRCWPCSTRGARGARRHARGRRSPSCRARSSSTGWSEAARFTPELRVLDYTGDASLPAGAALDRLRPGADDLRHAPAGRRRGSSDDRSSTT